VTGRRLAGRRPLTRPLAWRRALADPGALAKPDRARAQDAAQLARSRRVHAVTRAEREVLVITRHVARRANGSAGQAAGHASAGASSFTGADAGNREPVVGVRPGGGLRWVATGLADPLGQLSKLITAPLTDGRERDRVPGEAQCDLVWPAGAIMAAHRLDGQHRAINAT
jgi:hypothetical protein